MPKLFGTAKELQVVLYMLVWLALIFGGASLLAVIQLFELGVETGANPLLLGAELVVAATVLILLGMMVERKRGQWKAEPQRPTGFWLGVVLLPMPYLMVLAIGLPCVIGWYWSLSALPKRLPVWLNLLAIGLVCAAWFLLGIGALAVLSRVSDAWWRSRAWPYEAWKTYRRYLTPEQLEVIVEAGPEAGRASADKLAAGGWLTEKLTQQPAVHPASLVGAYVAGRQAERAEMMNEGEPEPADEYRWSPEADPSDEQTTVP